MYNSKLVGLVIGIVFFLFGAFYGFGYIGYRNTANQYENSIVAQYDQNKNDYDNGWKKVVEVAQVPTMQMQQTKELYDSVMTGRYGSEGSKAFVQFIHEQNPTLGPQVYLEIQQTVQTFHDRFEASQTSLISKKQEYNNFITATTDSIFYNWIGNFPHLHVGVPNGSQDDYAIVTSDKTETDFKNHKAEPLNLLGGPGASGQPRN
jgi:hypothetical protein